MISGASEQELELANARANIIMALDNTSTYESWLIIDTYIEKLEKENQELKNNWEILKNALIGRFNRTQDTTYLDILTDIMQPIEEKGGKLIER